MSWDLPSLQARVTFLKRKRNRMEGQLRRCELPITRDTYTLRIENINILLADIGVMVYKSHKHTPKF